LFKDSSVSSKIFSSNLTDFEDKRPPHNFSLGKEDLSIIITFSPSLAKTYAAVEPAGSAPTIATSDS